jgi:hypothetical protein
LRIATYPQLHQFSVEFIRRPSEVLSAFNVVKKSRQPNVPANHIATLGESRLLFHNMMLREEHLLQGLALFQLT